MSIFSDRVSKWLRTVEPEKQAMGRYARSDIGNGNLFADFAKQTARYCPDRGVWYYYDGKVWKADIKGSKTMELCKKLADALLIYAMGLPNSEAEGSYKSFVIKWQTRRYRETILKDAASVHPVFAMEFDTDLNLFNCKNGTLNLETFEFHPHNPDDMLTKMAGVKYVPGARCVRWEQFIKEVMQPDSDGYKAVYLQKAMGYGLTGEAEEECFFILFGPTSRNGKGTLMDTYMKLAGDYGRNARPETIARKDRVNGSAPNEDLARLAGARVVNISEPDKQLVLSAALIKTMTGRDPITVRFLHENSFEYIPQFKLFINTNYLPKVTDNTVFSSGRVKVIPFERHFSEKERDKGLKKKLAREDSLSGILNWCLEGLKLVRERGLYTPPVIQAAIEQYRHDSDKIARFMEEELEAGREYEVRTAEAYVRYKTWCQDNGCYSDGMVNFKSELEKVALVVRKRPKAGGSETTMILGYRLRPIGINVADVADENTSLHKA